MVAGLHIYAPQPTKRTCTRKACPVCGKRSVILTWFYDWYGPSSTCLRCGDMWSGGEILERPFARGWRQRNIEAARKNWRKPPRPTTGDGAL